MLSPNPSVRGRPLAPAATGVNSRGRSSSTGRSGSQDRTQSAAGQDPVLARYLQIKKEIEANRGDSQQPQPSAAATSVSRSHQQHGAGTPTPSSRATFSSRPQPSMMTPGGAAGSQQQQHQPAAVPHPASPRVGSSLYNTPLTPNTSVTLSPPRGQQQPAAPAYSHYQQQQQHQDPQRLNAASETVRSLVEVSKEAHVLRQKVLEMEADAEQRNRSMQMQDHDVANLKQQIDSMTESRSRLEEQLSRVKEENGSLRHSIANLERAVAEAGQGTMASKVLEGKVEAQNGVIEQQRRELDDERQKVSVEQQRVEDAARRIEQLQQAIRNQEMSAGEATVSVEQQRSENARLKRRLEDYAVTERQLQQKVMDLEQRLRDNHIDADHIMSDHKNELRDRNRKVNELELELVGAKESLREAENLRQRAHIEVAEVRQEKAQQDALMKDLRAEMEKMKVIGAQQSIVNDEQRFEIERHKKIIEELRGEIQLQEENQIGSDNLISELEQDRHVKLELENQVRKLNSTISKMEDDYEVLKSHSDQHIRRATLAEEEVTGLRNLRDEYATLKGQYDGKLLTIEKLYDQERRLQDVIDEQSNRMESTRAEADEAKREVVSAHDRVMDLKHQLEAAEERGSTVEELRGKVEALNGIIDAKTGDINHLHIEIDSWKTKTRELDADVEALLAIREQFDVLSQERAKLCVAIEERETKLADTERSLTVANNTLKAKQDEVGDCKEIIMSLEAQIARQTGQLADKAQVESTLRQTSSDLAIRTEELAREREKRDEANARSAGIEDALGAERSRTRTLEEQIAKHQAEVSSLQVQVGKYSVTAESHDRERERLQRDLDSKTASSEKYMEELASVKHQLTVVSGEAQQHQIRTRHLEEQLSSAQEELRDANDQIHRHRIATDSLQAGLRTAEDRIRHGDRSAEILREHENEIAKLKYDLRCSEKEVEEATALITEFRLLNKKLQQDIEFLESQKSTMESNRKDIEKKLQTTENLEKEEAVKTHQLIEKEKELGKLREQVSLLTADVDSESQRRRQFENRAKELESECQRASALEGQVAGLNLVVTQKTRDLEEERQAANELRNRIRQLERASSSQRANSVAAADLDAKLAIKNDIISQLEQEDRRRSAVMEQMKNDADTNEQERLQLQQTNVELRRRIESLDGQWVGKYNQLQAEFEDLRLRSSHAAATTGNEVPKLRAQLTEAHGVIAKLRSESESQQRVATPASAVSVTLDTESTRRSVERSEAMQRELARAQEELTASQEKRKAAERLLHEREVQLEIARRPVASAQSPQQSQVTSMMSMTPSVPPAAIERGHSPSPAAAQGMIVEPHAATQPSSFNSSLASFTIGGVGGAASTTTTSNPLNASTTTVDSSSAAVIAAAAVAGNKDIAFSADEEIRKWRERRQLRQQQKQQQQHD